jgi:hypothetical protein
MCPRRHQQSNSSPRRTGTFMHRRCRPPSPMTVVRKPELAVVAQQTLAPGVTQLPQPRELVRLHAESGHARTWLYLRQCGPYRIGAAENTYDMQADIRHKRFPRTQIGIAERYTRTIRTSDLLIRSKIGDVHGRPRVSAGLARGRCTVQIRPRLSEVVVSISVSKHVVHIGPHFWPIRSSPSLPLSKPSRWMRLPKAFGEMRAA